LGNGGASSQQPEKAALTYRKELDGLRALAVLAVVFYHAGFSNFSGGYAGVDVFFVVSGYLIFSLIIREREAGTFTIAGFYERRMRRILPALFLLLACFLPVALFMPGAQEGFAQSSAAVAAFVSNILFYNQTG
jgi:peptidoglycan/LPS O-acetylase OafA/YrhL